MNDTATAVEIAGQSKRDGKTEAVSSLALQVHAGTTFGLVGANGAGKTTLIKCMLAFCDLDAGHIAIFGVPSCRTEARKRLAFLPESFAPPYYPAGKDFLKYMAGMYERQFDLDECVRTLASVELDPDVLSKPVRALFKAAPGSTSSSGRTIFLTSHSLADVDKICDDMAPIHQGSLRFAGTPTALKQRHNASNLQQAYLACIGDS